MGFRYSCYRRGVLLVNWLVREIIERPKPANKAIEAFVDTLVPEDESPRALELNVVEQISIKTQTDRRFNAIVTRGSK